MKSALLSVTFCLSVVATIASALIFSLHSGFLASNGFRCSELLSSGRDDELAMMLFVVLLAPVMWRVWRWRHSVTAIEIGSFLGLYGLTFGSVLTSLECGSFFFTAFVNADGNLLAFCSFSLIALGVLIAGKIRLLQ